MALPYDGPLDWERALSFLAQRAVAGVERIEAHVYTRTIRLGEAAGLLQVSHDERGGQLVAAVRGLPDGATNVVSARVRRMFDLDADVRAIAAHLSRDPSMAALVASGPAPRVMRGWDGFEVAARSVIGQQVSVARARHLNGVLVDRCGSVLPADAGTSCRLFPTPQQVVDADLSAMGMPGARADALKHVAAAALASPGLFERGASIEETVARLRGIRGIGEWTAHYIAMRACGEPDAFPASDIGLLRGAADVHGRRPTPDELRNRADAWRPWRAYAAHQLWAQDARVVV